MAGELKGMAVRLKAELERVTPMASRVRLPGWPRTLAAVAAREVAALEAWNMVLEDGMQELVTLHREAGRIRRAMAACKQVAALPTADERRVYAARFAARAKRRARRRQRAKRKAGGAVARSKPRDDSPDDSRERPHDKPVERLERKGDDESKAVDAETRVTGAAARVAAHLAAFDAMDDARRARKRHRADEEDE